MPFSSFSYPAAPHLLACLCLFLGCRRRHGSLPGDKSRRREDGCQWVAKEEEEEECCFLLRMTHSPTDVPTHPLLPFYHTHPSCCLSPLPPHWQSLSVLQMRGEWRGGKRRRSCCLPRRDRGGRNLIKATLFSFPHIPSLSPLSSFLSRPLILFAFLCAGEGTNLGDASHAREEEYGGGNGFLCHESGLFLQEPVRTQDGSKIGQAI